MPGPGVSDRVPTAFQPGSEDFAKGYGFSAGGESFQMGDDGSSGRVKIPGEREGAKPSKRDL